MNVNLDFKLLYMLLFMNKIFTNFGGANENIMMSFPQLQCLAGCVCGKMWENGKTDFISYVSDVHTGIMVVARLLQCI